MKGSFRLTCVLVLLAVHTYGQSQSSLKDSVKVNGLLDSGKQFINPNPEKAIAMANQALSFAKEIGFEKGEALALKQIGLVYYYQGKFVQTLDYWNQSLHLFQSIGDYLGQSNLQGNIGAVFVKQGDDVTALTHLLEALRLAEKTGNQLRICFALNNIAGVYFEKKATWDKALEYYNKCLKVSDDENAAFAYNGLGLIYLKEGDVDKAFSFHTKAYELAKRLNEIHIVPSLLGLAATFVATKNFRTALDYYKEAEVVATSQKSTPSLKDLYDSMASTYASVGDFSKAFQYQRKLDKIKDTLFNETVQKKLNSLQFEFDLEKKEGEITLLTKDKVLQEVQLKRQRFVKNAFAVGLALILLILFIIYRDYRTKVRTNKILDKQKAQIEQLLLNILPSEVAQELQATGNAVPKSYEDVSVLFTDFKGFTTIADKLSPTDLVQELSNCFIAFDNIVAKYGLEKIKTIGDSYMCAGGLPSPDDQHHYKMVRAALEIQAYIFDNNEKRKAQDQPLWEVRIGIHNGPVVAGVVGRTKYAYDIWGSTVNIASRMESSGVPGQVNISEATFEKIKDKFACIYRGKIYAKNVGEVDMYLVDHETERFESKAEATEKHHRSNIIPG
jgi:adenylate cyclase